MCWCTYELFGVRRGCIASQGRKTHFIQHFPEFPFLPNFHLFLSIQTEAYNYNWVSSSGATSWLHSFIHLPTHTIWNLYKDEQEDSKKAQPSSLTRKIENSSVLMHSCTFGRKERLYSSLRKAHTLHPACSWAPLCFSLYLFLLFHTYTTHITSDQISCCNLAALHYTHIFGILYLNEQEDSM